MIGTGAGFTRDAKIGRAVPGGEIPLVAGSGPRQARSNRAMLGFVPGDGPTSRQIKGVEVFIAHRMGSRRSAARQLARLALILSVAVVLAGCDLINSALLGSGAGSIGGAFPSEPPQVPPDSWTIIELTNPRLQLEIPTTWQQVPSSAIEAQLKSDLPSMTGEDIAKAWQYEITLIDEGQALDFFQGQSADTAFTASIEIDRISNDDTLSAAVAREDSTDDAMFGPPETRDEVPVTLPVGPSIQEVSTSTVSGGAPSLGVIYVLRLDGSTILLAGSAPADDTTFVGLMAHVAGSLSKN